MEETLTREVGKRIRDTVYVHRAAISDLNEAEGAAVKTAREIISDGFTDWNVVKVEAEAVSFLSYEDFEESAFPQLLESWRVDLQTSRVGARSYRAVSNPPILHRKELLLPLEHPKRGEFADFTRELERLGMFAGARFIGFQLQWEERLARAGILIEDHSITVLDQRDEIGIARHRTAISRAVHSQPVQQLLRTGLLKSGVTFFDFGCGRGDDVRALQEAGFNANGWDPFYAPDNPKLEADVVNLGFVLNVIEDPFERAKVLAEAYGLVGRCLTVAVLTDHQRRSEVSRPYRDGILTNRGTFQKFFGQHEAREFIQRELKNDPVSAGPGVFLIFKDKGLEQEFLLQNRTRKNERAIALRSSRRDDAYVRRPRNLDLLKPSLETFWGVVLEKGRPVDTEELPEKISEEFKNQGLSVRRAFNLCRQELFDETELEIAETRRRQDLTVYFALNAFEGRVRYRKMPESLRRDVRWFFGSYQNALNAGSELLYSLRDSELVCSALEKCADQEIGYLMDDAVLQVQPHLIEQMDPILRCFAGCAEYLMGSFSTADLVKFHGRTDKFSTLYYDDFGKALPELKLRVKANLRTQKVRYFEYGETYRRYLFLKSLFLEEDCPDFEKQEMFDRTIMKLGIQISPTLGPDAYVFDRFLTGKKVQVSEFQLVSAA